MRVRDVLEHPLFQRAALRAGAPGLDREVTWVHVVDQPDPAAWVRRGQLVLTTGHALTGDAARQRAVLQTLADTGIAGLVLAVPTYFTAFPDAMIETANELALPLIEIPWEVPFVDVTEALHRIVLREQYAVVEASELVHRKLTRAAVSFRGLQDLAESLGELLHRAVAVEAADGTLLAHHRLDGAEDEVRVTTIATGRRDPSYVNYVRALDMDAALRQAEGPLRIPGTSDGRIAARVVCPVRLLSELVGYVWIIEGAAALSELDLRAAEHAATVAALHLAHRRELWRTEQRLGATLLDTLLELDGPPAGGLLERARLAGLRDDAPWRLVQVALPYALPLGEADLRSRDQIAVRWRGRLLDEGGPALVTTHLEHVIALVPAETDVRRIAEDQGLDKHRVLVSTPGHRLEEVRPRALDLQAMLAHVHDTGVHDHADFLLPRVLAGDARAKHELVSRMIGALEGAQGGETLRATLVELCRYGFQLNLTANALGVHISTLRYRLERLQDVLGHDLSNPETRFLLQLTFAVQRYGVAAA